MDPETETAALIALLRSGRSSPASLNIALEQGSSARALLDAEQGLLAEAAVDEATAELRAWKDRGIRVLSVFDPGYPVHLKRTGNGPPVLFLAGHLLPADASAVAVIGTRQPTPGGRQTARALCRRLVGEGYTIVSGLAAGIDTVAHETTLDAGGRTVAVIGSGLDHFYPRENAALQRRIGREGAVISQFWPESRPSRRSFPLRNELMAGLAEASVIVEATAMSGTRILARAAVGMNRAVVLLEALMEQPWARELAERPGVEVAGSAAEVSAALQRSLVPQALV